MSLQVDLVGTFLLLFAALVFIKLRAAQKKPGGLGLSSAKYPPVFSSSLSQREVLSAVEERLRAMTSIRSKWKIQDKVERIGRLQAMLTVPYNLAGDDIKISFLVNLLATAKPTGGCTVEWSYVMMAPFNTAPPEVQLWETSIYKQTTLEIRGALFAAQGDSEVADFVDEQAKAIGPMATLAAKEKQIAARTEGENAKQELKQTEPSRIEAAQPQAKQQQAEQQPEEPQESVKIALSEPAQPVQFEPSAQPPQPVQTESNQLLAGLPQFELPASPVLPASPEIPTFSSAGELPNTLNFSAPDPAIVSSNASGDAAKCIKCSQIRDASFNFCLYCGHVD